MNTFAGTSTLTLLAVLCASAAFAEPIVVAKTNPMKVYMHYMPWFESPDTLGANQWGYHWKLNNRNPNTVDETGKRQIASHYYPLIGPYASSDADVIEYHLLLMKLSGIDGVMIDWYGVEGTNGDIHSLLSNSNAIIRHVDDVGLNFGIVMEDRFSANIAQAKANIGYLRDDYFHRPEYIRHGEAQKPLLAVFGPITFQKETEWTEILAEAAEDVDFLTLWYESSDAGANAVGEFAWVYEDESLDNHLAHQSNFYRYRTPNLGSAGGVAYPGFNDFYEQGGVGNVVPFEIPHDDGQTLDAVLNVADQNAAKFDFLQLATFNDFGEGTMFEPTIETGFDYLKRIQQFTGTPYGEAELKLVYELYLARKEYAEIGEVNAVLDEVAGLLAALEIDEAADVLKTVAPRGDYDLDGKVDANDLEVWRVAYGSTTILYGSGADGNHDGVIDAADYTIWRDDWRTVSDTLIAAAVPEPSIVMLSIMAVITCCCGRTVR